MMQAVNSELLSSQEKVDAEYLKALRSVYERNIQDNIKNQIGRFKHFNKVWKYCSINSSPLRSRIIEWWTH